MVVQWDHKAFVDQKVKKGMDALEDWGKTAWHPQAYRDAPKLSTTMALSLGVERDDANKCICVGGGGDAKDYILKQELDRSLHHEVGKAGFISDSVQQNISKLPTYVKKHVG